MKKIKAEIHRLDLDATFNRVATLFNKSNHKEIKDVMFYEEGIIIVELTDDIKPSKISSILSELKISIGSDLLYACFQS